MMIRLIRRKFRDWRNHLDVLWWLQSDVVRLWRWLRSPLDLYGAAVFMPEHDYTVWQGARWGYTRRGLFYIPEGKMRRVT